MDVAAAVHRLVLGEMAKHLDAETAIEIVAYPHRSVSSK